VSPAGRSADIKSSGKLPESLLGSVNQMRACLVRQLGITDLRQDADIGKEEKIG
jgi:hypothetical protein